MNMYVFEYSDVNTHGIESTGRFIVFAENVDEAKRLSKKENFTAELINSFSVENEKVIYLNDF